MDFRAGDVQTVGLELELQLLDRHNLDLVDGVLSLLEFFPDNPYVKPESIQNTVELITPVCRSVGEMHAPRSGRRRHGSPWFSPDRPQAPRAQPG